VAEDPAAAAEVAQSAVENQSAENQSAENQSAENPAENPAVNQSAENPAKKDPNAKDLANVRYIFFLKIYIYVETICLFECHILCNG
jgi:hypothetical protein